MNDCGRCRPAATHAPPAHSHLDVVPLLALAGWDACAVAALEDVALDLIPPDPRSSDERRALDEITAARSPRSLPCFAVPPPGVHPEAHAAIWEGERSSGVTYRTFEQVATSGVFDQLHAARAAQTRAHLVPPSREASFHS